MTQDTTLYALWTSTASGKLATPAASIDENGISWNAVSGATGYTLTLDGDTISLSASETSYAFAEELTAGEHVATVTALGATSAQNSDAAMRYIAAKALSRVSLFDIVDSFVVFKGVANAISYYIDVECGNAAHNHSNIALGSATSYNFANCTMGEEGISFTVTATADAYMSSVSRTYVYKRALAAIDNLYFDEATETVSWNAVADAQSYVVSVICGAAHNHTLLNIGNNTSFSLASCGATADGITFSVYPVTNGYTSPKAATYTYNKTKVQTPDGLNVAGDKLVWNAIEGATYELSIGGNTATSAEASYDLGALTAETVVKVRALLGGSTSAWSSEFTIRYFAQPDGLTYSNGTLSWNGVFGAANYEISLNGGEAISTAETSAAIALNQAGANTLAVRTVPEKGDATAWTTVTVYAYAIAFNVNGGSALTNDTLYIALGDNLTLPETTRTEYDFAGWYNAKSGAAGNAKLYTSGLFLEGKDLDLYADWTGKKFKITYNLGAEDATLEASESTATYGENYTLDIPAREGYEFDGWFADAELTERLTDKAGHSSSAWAKAEDSTVYASWKQVLAFVQQADSDTYYVTAGPDIDSVTEITVPQTYNGKLVTAIYDGAFKNCRNLESVSFYDTIQTIGVTTDVVNGPFAGCENLKSVNVISSGVNNPVYYSIDGSLIENEAQTGLKALVFVSSYIDGEFTIPDGVQRIPGRLFANAKFRKVIVPASVEEIGVNAFFGCSNLNTVEFVETQSADAKALTLGKNAFYMCESLRTISLPSRVGEFDAESVFERCLSLTNIQVASGNAHYASADGILTNAAGNTALYFPYGRSGVITLPESIKIIGEKAFANRSKITAITIRETVESIGAYAFSGCSSLSTVTFAGSPVGVATEIGEYAFANCSALTNVKFAAQSKVTAIGTYAFANDKLIANIELPKSLTDLADYAFSGCSGLRSVTLSSGKSSAIGSYVFQGCTSLDTINLSESVTSIALNAFAGCDKLTTINVDEANANYSSSEGVLYNKEQTSLIYCSPRNKITSIPATVTEICDGAFASNGSIKNVTIGKNVTTIGANAFYGCAALETLTFENNRTESLTIGANAFELCSSLGALALPDKTTSVGESAFAKTGITTLTVPESVTSVGAGAFAECLALTTANFAADITALPENLFADCAKLASATLSDNITAIGAHAFDGASLLAQLNANDDSDFNLPASLTEVGASAFNGTSIAAVEIPASVTTVAEGAFANIGTLTSLTFANGEAELTIADGSASTGAFSHTSIASLALPARLAKLGSYAFANTKLASLTFAANGKLTAIGDYAFSYALTGTVGEGETIGLALPEGIATIGAHAFENGNIDALTLPQSLATLGDNAFAAQSKLASVLFTSGNASVDLAIGNYAFGGDGQLKSLTLSDSLKTIGTDAFSGCTSLAAFNFGEQGNAKGFETEENGGILYAYDISGSSKTIVNFFVPAAYDFGSGTFTLPDGVTAIPANAFYGSNISSVDLTGITSIGENAFRGTAISDITLPEGLKEIGAHAFDGTHIATLTIPATVTSIGDYAFANITYTVTTTIPATEEGGEPTTTTETHNGPSELTFAKLSNQANYTALTIGESAFANAGLTSVELPKRLIALGSNAFDGNSALATLTFEADRIVTAGGVTTDITLGNQAFNGTAITSVELPEGLTRIPTELFGSYTDTLKSIVIPSTVTEVGYNAFNSNTGLADVTFASGGADALTIAQSAFYNTAITAIELPARTSIIGQYAFQGCSSLASVTFENGGADSKLESIGDYAFNNSGSSADELAITLPDSVKVISRSAFAESNLHTFRMPASLTDIYPSVDDSSFYYGVFKNCKNLTTIDIGKLTVALSAKTFAGCSALQNIIVDGDNTAYSANNGVLFDKNGETLLYYPAGKTATEYIIPDSVITIAEHAFSRENSEGTTDMNKYLTSITMGKSVQTIGRYAFANMATITSIDFTQNNSLITVGSYSICGTSVSELTIPGSVTKIDDGAFYNSKLLRSLNFAEGTADLTIGDRSFENMGSSVKDIVEDNLTTEVKLAALVIPARVTSIGYSAFGTGAYVSKALTEVTVESGSRLTSIGNNAFFNQKITSFVLPEDVATIGESSFRNNSTLTSFTFNNVLATIGANAFEGTSALTEVTIPSSVTNIGNYAFFNSGLTKVTFRANAALTLGSNIFNGCSSLTNVTLPEGLTELGDSMFSGCSALTQIDLPQGLTAIASGAFGGTGITSIAIPSQVTAIGASAFSGATNLAEVDFSEADALTTIGELAFNGCTAITELSMPHSLVTIGNSAFKGLTALTKIEFVDSSLESIGSNAFANCTALTNFELPSYVNSIAADTFSGCTALELAISRYNTDFVMRDGIVYNRDTTSILYISPAKLVGKITIMDGVETIADGLFSNATELTEVVLPDSVTAIGANAFDGCSGITHIALPKYLETIGTYAFRGTKITSVNIPATTTFVGNNAFYNVATLTSLTFEKGGTTALSLGSSAFYGTGITELVIPARMRNYTAAEEDLFYGYNKLPGIGNYCFKDCFALKTITYEKDVVTDIPGVLSFGLSAFSSAKISSGKVSSYGGAQMNIETVELPSFVGTDSWEYEYGTAQIGYLKAFGNGCFASQSSLKSFLFEKSDCEALYVGNYLFACSSDIGTIVLPDNLVMLNSESRPYKDPINSSTNYRGSGRFMFQNCTGLESATMGDANVNGLFSNVKSTLKSLALTGDNGTFYENVYGFSALKKLFVHNITSYDLSKAASFNGTLYTDLTACPDGLDAAAWNELVSSKKLVPNTTLAEFNAISVE